MSAFTFEISLSVLNHLGRNLYRSFATVLGEAISNSWDADAKKVYIYIDKDSFFIKDDGIGMSAYDFQNKFLKIGYSKRKEAKISPVNKRPYIGMKGIGKLALLSCAEKITVISKKDKGEYVGGIIDNSGLNKAITDDLKPHEYHLNGFSLDTFAQHIKGHDHGTIIYFENIKDGIKHSLKFLKKVVALYFRFSILDKAFDIYMNGEQITLDSLGELASNTQFLWTLNTIDDPFIKILEGKTKEKRPLNPNGNINGFIASVIKPSHLTIRDMKERVTIDLFVNGRLRERNILQHIPTERLVESYLYGQIHYNDLDDGKDRFTSSREGIVPDDPKYKELLDELGNNVINKILDDWDNWRRKYREDGDPDNMHITKKARKAGELFNVVSLDFTLADDSKNKDKIDRWINDLSSDAGFNFPSYAECFISENLIRNYIGEKHIPLSSEADKEVKKWRKSVDVATGKGNISISIRKNDDDLSYLSMDFLANLIDKFKHDSPPQASLSRDATEYKPFRDAIAHTARLTDKAKSRLTTVYDNIIHRLKKLLSNS
ncbi:MAG: ATP-binding protein [Nitrospirae bacterium]|nr:ATP-binding protein [Nitrospirota bacterium]